MSLTEIQEMAEAGGHEGTQEHPAAASASETLGTPISALTLTDTGVLGPCLLDQQ